MKIRFRTFLLILITVCISIGIVVAQMTLSFHQNPTVPAESAFSTTPAITQSSDQTSLWIWDSESDSFNATITLHNDGTTAWTPTIVGSAIPSGWVFSTATLTSIPVNGQLPVTMTLHYTLGKPVSGAIGDFTVTIS